MTSRLRSAAFAGVLLLTACDTAGPASPAASPPASASARAASAQGSTTFTIPVTPGASEWDYVNISPDGQALPRTWEHPLGGIVSPRWLGRRPTASSPYLYEELTEGANDADRLLAVGQRMLQRVIDPVSFSQGSNESGVVVTSGSVSLPSSWEHWENALIVGTDSQTSFPYTVSAQYSRGRSVSFEPKDGPITFGMSGGREPGGFVFIEGRATSQRGRVDTDLVCRPESVNAITYSNQIPVNTTGAAQGARMKVGVYAQIGEFYLISPMACEGSRPSGQSMVDVEAREFTFFRRTAEAVFAINGEAASPTTTLSVAAGTGPVTVPLDLTSPTPGESITGVFVRSGEEALFSDRLGDPRRRRQTSARVTLPIGLSRVVMTTSTGRIARGLVSVCASITPSGCQSGGGVAS